MKYLLLIISASLSLAIAGNTFAGESFKCADTKIDDTAVCLVSVYQDGGTKTQTKKVHDKCNNISE